MSESVPSKREPEAVSCLCGMSQQCTHFIPDVTALTLVEDATSAAEHVDTVLRRVYEYKTALLEHRNSLVPVSRLPAEALCNIFRYCAPTPKQLCKDSTFLAFTQVCRRWRETALRDPFIWTEPLCTDPNLALEMMRRAKDHPRSIAIDCAGNSTRYSAAAAILEHGENISSLDISANSDQISHLIGRVTGPMLLLRRLKLNEPLQHQPVEDPSLGSNCIPWSVTRFTSLTTLEIIRPDTNALRSKFTELFDILARNSGLRQLVLKNAIAVGTPKFPIPEHQKVEMPNLVHFELNDDVPQIIYALTCLHFPRVSCLRIRSDKSCQSISQVNSVIVLLKKWHKSTDRGPLRVWSCGSSPRAVLQFEGDSEAERLEDMIEPLFSVCLDVDYYTVDDAIYNINVTRAFDFNHLKVLRVHCENYAPGRSCAFMLGLMWRWVGYKGRCPEVVEIHSSGKIFHELLTTFDDWQKVSPNQPPFPKLQLIRVVDTDLSELDATLHMSPLRYLTTLLPKFQEEGRPTPHVVISGCTTRTDAQQVFDRLGLPATVQNTKVKSGSPSEDVEDF